MKTLCAIFSAALSFSVLAGDVRPDWGIKIQTALTQVEAQVKPEKPRKLLIYHHASGFVHSSIPVGVQAITEMGKKTGAFEVTASDDPAVFDVASLKNYDAILLLSTTGDFLVPRDIGKRTPDEQKALREKEPERKKALLEFVQSGHGVAGIHAATDAYYKWAEYGDMMGGYFNGHPWGKINVKIDDPKSPLTAQFDGKNFEFSDEIYTHKDPWSREKLHVLLSIDLEKSGITKGENRQDHDYGVAWIREYGKGRVFYTLFGHREDTYTNPLSMKLFLSGLQYVLGDLKADATPSGKK